MLVQIKDESNLSAELLWKVIEKRPDQATKMVVSGRFVSESTHSIDPNDSAQILLRVAALQRSVEQQSSHGRKYLARVLVWSDG